MRTTLRLLSEDPWLLESKNKCRRRTQISISGWLYVHFHSEYIQKCDKWNGVIFTGNRWVPILNRKMPQGQKRFSGARTPEPDFTRFNRMLYEVVTMLCGYASWLFDHVPWVVVVDACSVCFVAPWSFRFEHQGSNTDLSKFFGMSCTIPASSILVMPAYTILLPDSV